MTIERWERQLNRWMEAEELDEDLARELRVLASRRDHKAHRELEERFYKDLEFGTSGLRGFLGAGTNRLNVHTVRWIMQGICDYIAEDLGAFDGVDVFTRTLVTPENLEKAPAVAIAYDSRNNSEVFAEAAAEVLVANGVKAYMFSEIVPVAALSFAVRKFGCLAGVMMTASHNPAEYNGVKVYNAAGCQVMPGEQKKMYARMKPLDVFADVSYLNFEKAKKTPYFEYIGDEVIEEYIDKVLVEKVIMPENVGDCEPGACEAQAAFKELKVLYTPLHGAGRRPCLEMMKRLGIGKVEVVKSQEKPDGNFTTCSYPNPETDEVYDEALEIARTSRPDIILATDPDCDRFGVLTKLGNGMYRKLSGNEVGIIILDYIIKAKACGKKGFAGAEAIDYIADREKCGTGADGAQKPARSVAVRSLTASALADVIARENDVEIRVIPNGSNYIGEAICKLTDEGRAEDFLFAFEDTNQCLSGTYTRDEDGVLGAMHILSAAAYAKTEGKNLAELLEEIYARYGYVESDSASVAFHGIEGLKKRDEIMTGLRSMAAEWQKGRDDVKNEVSGDRTDDRVGTSWNKIGDKKVENITDYLRGNNGFPPLDVVEFKFENDAGVIIRPSGTEPKLKIYMHAKGDSTEDAKKRCGEIERAIMEIVNV